MKYILVLTILNGNGIGVDNIPEFKTKAQCELAALQIEEKIEAVWTFTDVITVCTTQP